MSWRRLRERWRNASLGVTFLWYLVVYLVVATTLAGAVIGLSYEGQERAYSVELTNGGASHSSLRSTLFSGPYVYDARIDELVPATEIDVSGTEPLAVFLELPSRLSDGSSAADASGGTDGGASSEGRDTSTYYATLDDVRSGKVILADWGMNYSDARPARGAWESARVDAEGIRAYDRESRELRAQTAERFQELIGADTGGVVGEVSISNVAYYAYLNTEGASMSGVLALLRSINFLAPFVSYGGLAIVMFRRFYRLHIAEPLAELEGAAGRIAARDLDFSVACVRGKELGRLSRAFETMRSSLLQAQRELWRTAEGRRRLNAAFAHDLRTPITVLKGTVEMARMRIDAGRDVTGEQVDKLAAQVRRLERYAQAMGGLSKLEDRPLVRADLDADAALAQIADHARDVAHAWGDGVTLRVEVAPLPAVGAVGDADDAVGETEAHRRAADATRPDGTVALDMPLIEEVLDNLLGNAATHARAAVTLTVGLCRESDALMLRASVRDDGPGFSPEALRRGCDPFFSERKGGSHFGLGLNVASVLASLHGGSLELANAEDGGAVATARFDASPHAPQDENDGADDGASGKTGDGAGHARRAHRAKKAHGGGYCGVWLRRRAKRRSAGEA